MGPLKGDITVTIASASQTKRKRRRDEQNKISFDALAGIAYDDDSQINAFHLTPSYNPTNPRIGVVVQETTAL